MIVCTACCICVICQIAGRHAPCQRGRLCAATWAVRVRCCPTCSVAAVAGAPNGSGFLGTGHGGEYVFAVALHSTAGDSRNLLTPGQHAQWPAGTGLTVVKESQIGPFLSTEEVAVGVRGVRITVNLTVAYAVTSTELNFLYPCMTMFALPFKQWIAATANGTQVTGVFASDDSFTLRQRVRWVAVYDGVRLGAVYQYPVGNAYNGSAPFQNEFWNRAYDHKLYFRTDTIPAKGHSFIFTYNISAFTAEPAEWIKAAKEQVAWPV
eukprot:m.1216586 g.1216586  ORF g.1216586 m.1216586 type:complete len:265 (+) comp24614_c0_seq7:3554-4348(+)